MATGALKDGDRREGAAAFSPLYKQIKDLLLQALDQGEWRPGEAIPSELELAARFQVSQGTVRKAVDELAAEHILIRRQGKGTFVATHQEARVRFRFLRLVSQAGEMGNGKSEILLCKKVRANAEMARELGLSTGDGLVFIRRLLSFSGKPTVVDDIYLPQNQFKGMSLELLQQNDGPLYWFFESRFGVSMLRADEKIRAVAASAEVADLLGVETGYPVLRVDRISYTYGDRAVELRYGHYVTDEYYYRNSLN